VKQPNVIVVFGDQWRAQAFGYTGDPNVQTPRIDALAAESVDFCMAVSGCPVCSPYRASLMTGQRPLHHGVFVNDVPLEPKGTTLAEAFSQAGYDTAYIGKWHIDGHGRSNHIPTERHIGFDYWKVLECTHDYNHSPYYAGDSDEKLYWEGYDAIAQTRDAQAFLREHREGAPFLLGLSWGPPHAPYGTAPERFRAEYDPKTLALRPNVPPAIEAEAREWLAGYYAHCSALDTCVGDLLDTLDELGLADNTILLFTSDHGDMLGSQGQTKKQRPYEESIRIPFLLRYPGMAGWAPRQTEALIDAQDVMPTLLGLAGLPIPDSVEGLDFSTHVAGGPSPNDGATLLTCPQPFGQWTKAKHGGREYRGLRTARYTYARDLEGPWLLYDNEADPFQQRNRVLSQEMAELVRTLDDRLQALLDETGDRFEPGMDYIRRWGYQVDETGTVTYSL